MLSHLPPTLGDLATSFLPPLGQLCVSLHSLQQGSWLWTCSVHTCLPGLWPRPLLPHPIHPLYQADSSARPHKAPGCSRNGLGLGWLAPGPCNCHELASLPFSLLPCAPDTSFLEGRNWLPGLGAWAVTQGLHVKGLRTWYNALLSLS